MRRARALATTMILLAACTQRDRAAQQAPDAAAVSSAGSASPASSVSARASKPAGAIAEPAPAPRPFRIAPVDAPVVPPMPEASWAWKTYRGDGFSIAFPGEPRVSVLPAEDDRVGYTEAKVDVPGGQVSFAAGFTDESEEEVASPEIFLDERVDAPRRGSTDVLHKRSIKMAGGHPGRVLILRRNISGTDLRVYSRLYLVKRRLYSLIVSTLDVGGVSEDVVKRFMDSFKLL